MGKDETRPSSVLLSEYIVLKFAEPFSGCGKNITTDNFSKRATLVGTIKSNKRELPKSARRKKTICHVFQLRFINHIIVHKQFTNANRQKKFVYKVQIINL